MNETTATPRREQINYDALVMRVLDLEQRLRKAERLLLTFSHNASVLMTAEIERVMEGFTPEQRAEVVDAASAEANRIIRRIVAEEAVR